MLNLGIKEQVINLGQLDRINFYDGSIEVDTAAKAASAGAKAASELIIDGYGRFSANAIDNVVCERGVKPSSGYLQINPSATGYTAPTAALGTVSFVVDIDLIDLRNPSNSGRNAIKHGGHVTVEVQLDSTDTTRGHAYAKIVEALKERKALWPGLDDEVVAKRILIAGSSPWASTIITDDTTVGAATQGIRFYTTQGVVGIKSVTFKTSSTSQLPLGSQIFNKTRFTEFTPLAYTITTATQGLVNYVPADEGRNLGKWLEENVQMGSVTTTDIYAVRAGEVPDVNGIYSCFYFSAKPSNFKGEHTSPIWNQSGIEKTMEFCVWVQELGTVEDQQAIAPNSKIDMLVKFLDAAAGTKALYKTDGTTATTTTFLAK